MWRTPCRLGRSATGRKRLQRLATTNISRTVTAIKHNARTADEFCRCASAAVPVGIGDSARQHVALQIRASRPVLKALGTITRPVTKSNLKAKINQMAAKPKIGPPAPPDLVFRSTFSAEVIVGQTHGSSTALHGRKSCGVKDVSNDRARPTDRRTQSDGGLA